MSTITIKKVAVMRLSNAGPESRRPTRLQHRYNNAVDRIFVCGPVKAGS